MRGAGGGEKEAFGGNARCTEREGEKAELLHVRARARSLPPSADVARLKRKKAGKAAQESAPAMAEGNDPPREKKSARSRRRRCLAFPYCPFKAGGRGEGE